MKTAMFDIDNPAKDMHELCDYLKTEEQDTPYVYRGQTKEYNVPLLPSMYRQHISYSDRLIERHDTLYTHSLKKIGNKFYGDYVTNFQNYKDGMFKNTVVDNKELLYVIYHKALKGIELLFSQQASRVLYNSFRTRIDLIRSILSKEEMQLFSLYEDIWMPSINNYDRRMIRMFGFYKPLGYVLGTALAQQYGFSSEGLDATKDIEVACFFATHSSKDYYSRVLEEGVGVIYRFPYTHAYAAQDGCFQYQFYSPHSVIDIDNIFCHLACDTPDIDSFFNRFKTFYSNKMLNRYADYSLIQLPKDSYGNSRIQRQKAVVILPDEIREDDEMSELSIIGNRLPRFQYIEDLSSRDGVDKYYFRHSENNELKFNREYFWPREDPVLKLVVWIVSSLCQRTFSRDNHLIVNRLDLIDSGYDPGEFLVICMKMALDNLLVVSPTNTVILKVNN